MTRRTKIGIAGVLLILIIVLVILWLLRGDQEPVTPTTIVVTEQEEEVQPPPEPVEIEVERETRIETASLQTLAKTFAERYGSFSTEANFQNLVDVMPLMADGLADATESFIATAEAPSEFYSVNTKVITVTVDSLDEEAGTATVSLTTQREEAIGGPQNTSVKFQDIILDFVFDSGSWKVSSANWQ